MFFMAVLSLAVVLFSPQSPYSPYHSFHLLHTGQTHLPKTSRHDSSSDWLPLANGRFEQQVGGAPVLTARYALILHQEKRGDGLIK